MGGIAGKMGAITGGTPVATAKETLAGTPAPAAAAAPAPQSQAMDQGKFEELFKKYMQDMMGKSQGSQPQRGYGERIKRGIF